MRVQSPSGTQITFISHLTHQHVFLEIFLFPFFFSRILDFFSAHQKRGKRGSWEEVSLAHQNLFFRPWDILTLYLSALVSASFFCWWVWTFTNPTHQGCVLSTRTGSSWHWWLWKSLGQCGCSQGHWCGAWQSRSQCQSQVSFNAAFFNETLGHLFLLYQVYRWQSGQSTSFGRSTCICSCFGCRHSMFHLYNSPISSFEAWSNPGWLYQSPQKQRLTLVKCRKTTQISLWPSSGCQRAECFVCLCP